MRLCSRTIAAVFAQSAILAALAAPVHAQSVPPVEVKSPVTAGRPMPGFYRPSGDSIDGFERKGSSLIYKLTFDKYSCLKVEQYWPDESHAQVRVRRDLRSAAVSAFVDRNKLEPALYCSEDGVYSPPERDRFRVSPQRGVPVAVLPDTGYVSLHDAVVYASPMRNAQRIATLNKGDCIGVKGYARATAHSHVVFRNPRDPTGPAIEGYVVRLQTDRARVCMP